jgi:hypothetical protein
MAEKNIEKKSVFALTERDQKTFWTRIGAAFTNKDGSITVVLEALPVSGRLQIREDEERDERTARTDRKPRR